MIKLNTSDQVYKNNKFLLKIKNSKFQINEKLYELYYDFFNTKNLYLKHNNEKIIIAEFIWGWPHDNINLMIYDKNYFLKRYKLTRKYHLYDYNNNLVGEIKPEFILFGMTRIVNLPDYISLEVQIFLAFAVGCAWRGAY